MVFHLLGMLRENPSPCDCAEIQTHVPTLSKVSRLPTEFNLLYNGKRLLTVDKDSYYELYICFVGGVLSIGGQVNT